MQKRKLSCSEALVLLFMGSLLLVMIVSSMWHETKTAKPGNKPAPPAAPPPHAIDLASVPISNAAPIPGTISLFFCIDVSGSMSGKLDFRRKIDISKEAMHAVFKQIDDYAKANPGKKIKAGLGKFSGQCTILKPLAPFDRAALEQALDALTTGGNTAIGDAITMALREVVASNDETKAILVMTDGDSNNGVTPDKVTDAIKKNRNNRNLMTADVELFLIAFDVSSNRFTAVKNAGATVMESRDAASLSQIMTGLVEEVLLEAP